MQRWVHHILDVAAALQGHCLPLKAASMRKAVTVYVLHVEGGGVLTQLHVNTTFMTRG